MEGRAMMMLMLTTAAALVAGQGITAKVVKYASLIYDNVSPIPVCEQKIGACTYI